MTHYTNTNNPIDFPKVGPNPKIRELIMSMGIIPESEHYDIAELVIRECMDQVWYTREDGINGNISEVIKERMKAHFGLQE